MKRRALILAHGHPDFSKGGAELAAHALHRAINQSPGWESFFVARSNVPGLRHTGTPFGLRPDPREILFSGGCDSFQFAADQPRDLWRDFADLLRRLSPDVVHFHHYANFGVEALRVVRNTLPQVPIVLTLHEYLAICNQNGQMLKSSGALCHRASPGECHACLPGRSPQDYLLRELYIKSFFKLVDRFVAPSEFLRSRYIAWGLPPARISVLENLLPDASESPVRELAACERRGRFAYFGQITPFKGLAVALKAFAGLSVDLRALASLDVHGGGAEMFSKSFRRQMAKLLDDAPREVHHHGPYGPEDLPRLMQAIDWVVVPSIWWENSPLVIQEAFRHRRPVICSDIGGMAEKVRDGVDGLHFRAGSSADLARALTVAIRDPDVWSRLREGIRPAVCAADSARAFLDLYRSPQAAAVPNPVFSADTQ
ncbi:MAG: glycosyltransferase family 4 protein [Panacagrimonas sp.]